MSQGPMATGASHRDRLGPAWRIGLVTIGATLLWLLVRWGGDEVFGAGYDRLRHVLTAVATAGLVVPLVLVARRLLDRRPWAGLALDPVRTGWRPFLVGALCYLLPAAVALAVAVPAGWVSVGQRAPVADIVVSTLGLVLLVLLFEALPEELVFRGHLYRNLVAALPRWLATIVQAALFTGFAIAIGAAGTPERIAFFFAFGWILGVIRAVTGSLWAPIGFHLAFQTATQVVGPSWGLFAVDSLDVLQSVWLGLIPLTVGVAGIQVAAGFRVPGTAPVRWSEREPDVVG